MSNLQARLRHCLVAWLLLATTAIAAPDATAPIANESPWPRSIKAGTFTLTIYQPQIDSWDGHALVARVAVQVASGDDPPQTSYGVAKLEARTLTDKGKRLVTIDQVKVTASDFPSADAARKQEWVNAIARGLVGKSRTIALDRLEAQLDAGKGVAGGELKNTPPHILFSQSSALLVYVDGEPAYRPLAGTAFERVINTRPLLLRDKQGLHYLKVFDGWMSAPAPHAQWQVVTRPSQPLQDAFKKASDARTVDPLTGQSTPDQPAPSLQKTVPVIYVATVPTELIVTDGPPSYKPIAGTQLLYVGNTTGRVFKHIADNSTYVLATGRWFHAATESGPWAFVAADKLPDDFAKIPDDSPVENVKASIAGTPQAREAAIAASLPQTAAVKISGTQLTAPVFDGDPVFKPVAGTSLQYAANTATPILRVEGNTYYAVENAVWFVSTSARGPWVVARSVPAVIYTIPPDARAGGVPGGG